MIANIFCFLVSFITPTGPMATRYTGGLSQLLLVKMSWGKKLREKPMVENKEQPGLVQLSLTLKQAILLKSLFFIFMCLLSILF